MCIVSNIEVHHKTSTIPEKSKNIYIHPSVILFLYIYIKFTLHLHNFMRDLCQIVIPVSAVFTAVSMRPSRPPIAWKKNSDGVKPARYEFSTKPRDSGP